MAMASWDWDRLERILDHRFSSFERRLDERLRSFEKRINKRFEGIENAIVYLAKQYPDARVVTGVKQRMAEG